MFKVNKIIVTSFAALLIAPILYLLNFHYKILGNLTPIQSTQLAQNHLEVENCTDPGKCIKGPKK